ncbi:relaxase [uncultured Roseobacter sp.]|uniref:relaxase/mobilization nuclease domain-containing protein n=1 Tax=uncultured Roseobacter sp. TaxID=114847 RepID=UPI002620B99A|nr:relaxase [uncultured Roseobacter sp.]
MILNGNQRGGGLKLAAHLTNMVENDHVTLHELRGFSSETLRGALQEADAIAKGTQCKQFLFSLSLSPPETEQVPVGVFEAAVADIEKRLGLSDQPRAIVFHEKNGRRHAHAVWSRIDVQDMKAINLPFYHNRLTELSKDLFLQHGWRLPEGLRDRKNRNPTNFSLSEWQQAKRAGKDARAIKRMFQEAWQVSDNASAFAHALEDKGYFLARGDRRGYVALDAEGEVYAVPKWAGVKTKDVREKLGSPKTYRSVQDTQVWIAEQMQPALSTWEVELAKQHQDLARQQAQKKARLKAQQQADRKQVREQQEQRRKADAKERHARFRRGLNGLWDRLRGAHNRIRQENEREAWQAHLRDQSQMDDLVFRHLEDRRRVKRQHDIERSLLEGQRSELAKDRDRFDELRLGRRNYSQGEPSLAR